MTTKSGYARAQFDFVELRLKFRKTEIGIKTKRKLIRIRITGDFLKKLAISQLEDNFQSN